MIRHRGISIRLGCIAFAMIALGRGLTYLPYALGTGEAPPVLQLFSQAIPLTVWAIVWGLVGLLALVGCALPKPRPVLITGVSGMAMIWAIAYVLGMIVLDTSPVRYIGTLLLYLALSMLASLFAQIEPTEPAVAVIPPLSPIKNGKG